MTEDNSTYTSLQNLGFLTNSALQDSQFKSMNRKDQLMRGLYYYINSDRDDFCRTKSSEIFGRNALALSDKDAPYFLGNAVLLAHGYTESPYQYFLQHKKPLPADVVDENAARVYIGNQIIKEFRDTYDRNAKVQQETLSNIDALLDGTITPDSLTEQQVQNIEDSGLSLNDIEAARKGLAFANRSMWDKTKEAGKLGYEALKNNFKGVYENIIKGAAQGISLELTGELIAKQVTNTLENWSAPYAAFSDNIEMADFLRSHDGDKQTVMSLIGDKIRRQAAKEYESSGLGGHLLQAVEAELDALTETIAMYTPENQPTTDSWKTSSRIMMNRMDYLTFLRDAAQTGREEAREKKGDTSWWESAGELTIAMLPYLNPAGEVLGGLRVANEGMGRAIAALTDEDGVTPSVFDSKGVQAFGKGLVQGQADAALRGISTRAVGRTFARLAPKASAQWGVKTMSRYGAALAAEWGVTTANFAVFLPLAENGVNALYDEIAPQDSKLDTGKKQLQQLWDDVRSLDYWGGNALAGLVWAPMGARATRHNSLSASRLNDIFRMHGLKENKVADAQKIPDLKERAETMNSALMEQKKADPSGTLAHAIAETKKIKSKAEQEAVIKRAQEKSKDEAVKATLQLYGISVEANPTQGKVDIYTGGKYNETTKSFERGTDKITLSPEDANLYLGSIMNQAFESLTHQIRQAYGSENLMAELSKIYGDRLKLEAILAPEMLDKVRERAKEAQEMVDKRVKELMEATKNEDGKATLSEEDARKQALAEVHPAIHKKYNMGELITFGENLEKRAAIEKAMSATSKNNIPVGSRAFVLSLPRKIGDSIRRILRYTKDVSAREITEEYGEIYLEDYMADTGASYTDTWRTLEDFRATMGDKAPKLTALRDTNANLAERIANGAQDADLSTAEMDDLHRDVREAMSLLLLSDLRGKAARGDVAIPEWARPLFDADLVARQRMETETAIAAGLRMANEMGLANEAALNLLNVSSKELERALAAIENPTESTYYQTFQDWNLRFNEADMRLDGLNLEELDAFEKANAQAQQELEEEQREEEERRAKPARETVAELEESGVSHEEAVQTVNNNIITAKEETIASNPYVQKNEAFANGMCVEVTDDSGIICYSGVVNVSDLKLLTNFKLNSDAETGEVNPLQGDYQADHDPIRVFQADDGTLTVISGRHRLAHAKRNGVTKIAAYIYKQNEQQDIRWAQQRDIEWNIRDNQASPLEVALYVRGELIEGVPALTEADMERIGMKRKGSQAYQGYIIGTKACDAVINALRNEQIEEKEAEWISLFSSNAQIQMAGLRAAAEGDGKTGIQFSMGVEQGRLELMDSLGLQDTADLFGELLPNEAFQTFVDKYSKLKLKELNERSAYLNALTKKKSSIYAKEYETIINNPSLLKAEKSKVAEQKIKWQNPYLHPELRDELQDAYKKADLEGWAAAEERAKQKAADTPAEEGLPLFEGDNATQAKEQGLFNDGVLETSNAVVTEPEFDFSIQAMHASPHEFYKFDTAFMGSGEGAQAYGWGLYFATNVKVNKFYFDQFNKALENNAPKISDKANKILKELEDLGVPFYKILNVKSQKDIISTIDDELQLLNELAQSIEVSYNSSLERYPRPAEKYREAIRKEIAKRPKGKMARFFFDYSRIIKAIRAYNEYWSFSTIHGIDTEWTAKTRWNEREKRRKKNLNELPAERDRVGAKIKKLKELRDEADKIIDILAHAFNYKVELNVDDSNIIDWYNPIPEELWQLAQRKVFGKETYSEPPPLGMSFYKELTKAKTLGSPKAASIWLLAHGYKGIKHENLYDRSKGNKTYNYIIFSGDDIKITAINKSGKWSMKEGWEEYNDPTANFSLISDHLQSWQRDPVAELGELGRFGTNIQGKLAPIGDTVYDQRVTTMINALRRRQIELQHIKEGSKDDSQKIFGEMAAIVNQLTSLLPNHYRFGLEPYIDFLTVYADLYGKGEPDRAGNALPMSGWPEIMARSFKKQVERLLAENMRPEDESLFFDIFNEASVRFDLAGIYKDLKETRKRYVDEVKARWIKTPLDSREAKAAFELEKKQARQEAFDDIEAKYAEEFKTAYKAIGEMRAHRLMDKFLARVIKKLDNHRKDRILGRIIRAIDGLTPRKEKNGKPVHGRVDLDVYNKVQDYKHLLMMTASEKALVDEQYADMAQMKPDSIIEVYTYDSDGGAIAITTTVADYNTYAGFESMSAEQADIAAASLGTFIKEGKAAWQVAEKATNDAVADFCAPMYSKWSETEAARKKRKEQQALKPLRRNKILNSIATWFNDSQLFRLCGSVDGFEHLKDLTQSIAQAHTYMLTAEKENTDWAYNSLDSVLGVQSKSKKEKAKAKRDFITHINTNKACNITLSTQPPDFAAQHEAALRISLLRRLFSLTRQKNFHINKFAAAVKYITDSRLLPESLVEEVQAKYGHIGDAEKYKKGGFTAYNEYFRSQKFAHLLNINKTIKERTAKSLDEWQNGKFDESGNMIKAPVKQRQTTITEITPNQAAYRLLLAEQEDYSDMLRRQGYTPAVLKQLREIAGEQMMQYAYALRERMNARTDTLKAIYEQTFGVPFPQVHNYFRAYFDSNTASKKDTSLTDLNLGFGSGEGSIEIFYTRQKHNASINSTMNVTTAYALGTRQQDVIIAYSDPRTHQHLGLFLNKVFNNTNNGVRMADVMENGLGKSAFESLKRQADNMFRIFGESEGGDEVLNRIMSDVGTASSISILNSKFSSLLKNTMSLFNTLGGSEKAGALAWYSSLCRVLTGNAKITPEQIMKEPVIRDRFKGWDYDADKEALRGLTGEVVTHGATDAQPRYGMAAFGKIDQNFTAKSAATLYDAVYRKLQRENKELTHEALHALCMDEVAKALGLKGQPMDFRQRALNASRVDWRTLGSYFLGGESWNTFTNCMRLWGESNVFTPEGRKGFLNASAVWITQGTMMSLLNWGYYFITDDEEHWEKRNFLAHMALGTIAGPISGMPIISNLVAGGLNAIGHAAGWRNMPYLGTPGFFPMMDIFRTIPALKKAFLNQKLSWWDKSIIFNDAVRAAAFATMVANMRPTSKGKATALAAGVWASAISNGIDFALRLGRAADERLFTDDEPKKKKKGRKSK